MTPPLPLPLPLLVLALPVVIALTPRISILPAAVPTQHQASRGAEPRENHIADDGACASAEESVSGLVLVLVCLVVRVRLSGFVVAAIGVGGGGGGVGAFAVAVRVVVVARRLAAVPVGSGNAVAAVARRGVVVGIRHGA